MLDRRQFLILGGAAVASSFVVSPVEAALRIKPERSLILTNIHTGETFKGPCWAEGRYIPRQLAALNKILRDHRTGDIHSMDPKVIDLLAALQHRLGGKKGLQVISAYRSPASNEWLAENSDGVARQSLHMDGKAVDIRIPGISTRTVAKAAKSLKGGGVGSYPRSNFVHLDSGKVRSW